MKANDQFEPIEVAGMALAPVAQAASEVTQAVVHAATPKTDDTFGGLASTPGELANELLSPPGHTQDVGNQWGEHVSETQTRLAHEGLRRHEGDSPHVGGPRPEQSDVIHDKPLRPVAHEQVVTDSTLNWGGGNPTLSHGGLPELPYPEAAAAMSGVALVQPWPSMFGTTLPTPPDLRTSRTGRDLSGEEIVNCANSSREKNHARVDCYD